MACFACELQIERWFDVQRRAGSDAEGSSAQLLWFGCLCSIHIRLCRDVELTLNNESANHAFSLIELFEHLNFSHFLGSFGTLKIQFWRPPFSLKESSDMAAPMLKLSTCRSRSLARKESWTGVESASRSSGLVFVMYGPFGNAGFDFVDLDVNEAGMRLSSRITSWSEVGERLK